MADEPNVGATAVESTDDIGIDIDAGAEKISEGLFGPTTPAPESTEHAEGSAAEHSALDVPVSARAATSTPPPSILDTPTTTPVSDVPKAWPKDMHEHWGTLDPTVKSYLQKRETQMLDGLEQYKGEAQLGRSMKEVVGPYLSHMERAGIEPKTMVGNLLNAHWILTRGTAESKAAYEKLGRDLGFVTAETANPAQPVNPDLQAIRTEMDKLRETVTARQQAEYNAQADKVKSEVDTFAQDTAAHPYWEECADDIVALLNAYPKLSLQDAYDRAVYTNPVTRAKELAKVETTVEARLRENKRLDALPKKKSAGANIHGSESAKGSPTEPLGSFRDTLHSTMRSIKERTH